MKFTKTKQGEIGLPGACVSVKGEKGDNGLAGGQGIKGEPGINGGPGKKNAKIWCKNFWSFNYTIISGTKGEPGVIGMTGLKGDLGPLGPKGDKGSSFLENLFSWINLLKYFLKYLGASGVCSCEKGSKGDQGTFRLNENFS